MMEIDTLRHITPNWIKKIIPAFIKKQFIQREPPPPSYPSIHELENLMNRYQVKNLVNLNADAFKERIDRFLQLQNHSMEGFEDFEKQRDLSIKFHWGHDHDFGSFQLKGLMGKRHIHLLSFFIDEFHILPRNLSGMSVLDIGCWTGGTSMLLNAMGARVVAIDEVKKYVDCLEFLKEAFGLNKLEPLNLSLYQCTTKKFQDAFDFVLFAGVLYHVTDPVLALRITFNALKDGGYVLLETTLFHSDEKILSYAGPTQLSEGKAEDMSRHGWNWFHLSPPTLKQMMTDVGFVDVKIATYGQDRMYAIGKRKQHVDMLRAGLSVRDIR